MPQDLSTGEERRGFRNLMLWGCAIGLVVFIGLLAWPLLPGRETGTPPGYAEHRANAQDSAAGVRSNQGSGESNVGRADPQRADDPTGGKSRQINQSAQAATISQAQQDQLRAYFQRPGVQRAESVDFTISIGGAVPAQAQLQPLPPEVSGILQGYQGDSYALVRDQLVVVDAKTRRIVAIIPGLA
jgi:hypothetical protein